MRRDSYIFSGALHISIALLSVFGLPWFFKEPPIDDQPIVVDIVPLGEKTNPPPKQADNPQPEPPKPEAKPEPAKAEPPKPTAAPPPPPKPEQVPLPPEPKPAPKPEAKPEPAKAEPPKPEPKPQPDTKSKSKAQDDLESLLKSVDKLKPKPKDDLDKLLKTAEKVKATDQGNQPLPQSVRGSASNNPNEPVSMTEIDMIRAQIYRCWNIPAGAKDAADMIRYGTDSFYRAAADSARRAVLACSPLKAPPSKYEQWRELTLRFNPKEMVGQ